MSQQRISNPPILSSARAGWDGILVEKYRLPASESHELSQYYGISVGCSSQSNFTALFRKHVGITPRAYREQIKSKGIIF